MIRQINIETPLLKQYISLHRPYVRPRYTALKRFFGIGDHFAVVNQILKTIQFFTDEIDRVPQSDKLAFFGEKTDASKKPTPKLRLAQGVSSTLLTQVPQHSVEMPQH